MTAMSGVRRYAAGALAVVSIVTGWRLALPPEPPVAGTTAFSFHARPLSPPTAPGDRVLRTVAPGYANVRGWVSAPGAAVALFDVDGEVVADDVCLVDPRRDTVTVRPAPGTSRSYRPFTLVPPDRRPYEAPTGCLPADLDQDGWEDLVVYYWGRSPSLFLRVPWAVPSGTAFRHRPLTTEREIWNTGAATAGDFDGDGRLDLVFGNYLPDGVLALGGARTGTGTGSDEAVMPDSLSAASNGGTDRLYRATGPATFAEAEGVFDELGGGGWTLALGTQDLDGDGRPELYVANDFGPDRLLVNESAPGRIRFTEALGPTDPATPRSRVLGRDSFKGMGVGFTDLNTDGRPDILVSNATGEGGPHESNLAFVSGPGGLHAGLAPYRDRAGELGLSRGGWSWDVKAADFDNDGTDEIMHATGFLRGEVDRWAQLHEAASTGDLFLSRPAFWPVLDAGDDVSGREADTFYTAGPDGRYADVAASAGVGGDAVSRAFAVGDVDDDGRLDFAVANQWARSVLYGNHGPTAPFVGLRLRLPAGSCGTPAPAGPGPTRAAIGAVATVRLPGGGTRTRQLYPAVGHNGFSAPELLFGLGADLPVSPLAVEVSWRDACGKARTASISLEPGWHRVLLADGRAVEVRP
ncbi:CRTAC1 family protein [Streptosporangium longisporum]|uniref:CRTAC1 family protein n=1 Tax=Streptosporangium longisporum TaxID=46187 RepID=A0ABN3XWR9_9ACTN